MEIDRKGLQQVSFVPTWFSPDAQVEVLPREHEVHQRILELLSGLSTPLGTQLHQADGEVLVDLDSRNDQDTRELLRKRTVSYPSWRWLSTEGQSI
jgi:hypothetical protein